MRLLICGDRYWRDRDFIKVQMQDLPKDTVIIEGEASGADKISRAVAIELGLQVERYPAKWDEYGRAAGPIRNTQMLDEGRPDECWAFHDHIEQSKGTKNMLTQCQQRGVPFKLFGHAVTV